ncbi:MAG: DMT family transporter [Chromatiales bacterium]|nr:DMT family transporter [Chromatiales bacterium]
MSQPTDRLLSGMLAMLAAIAFFAFMDAVLKLLVEHYPPLQVSALRGIASLPFVLLPALVTGRWHDLMPVRWGLHLVRGVLALLMMVGFVYAVRVLSLADAYAVFFVAPLLVAALSVPLLGERVGPRRWLAILAGLAAVIYIIRPTGVTATTLGLLAAFGAAVAYALGSVIVRVLTRTDTTSSMVLSFMLFLALFAGLLAWPDWVPLRRVDWGLLVALGLLGAIAQVLLTEAFRRAPAALVAPFEYTAILWAIAIDWVVWAVLPGSRVFVGGGIIVAAGLFLIWRENRTGSAK